MCGDSSATSQLIAGCLSGLACVLAWHSPAFAQAAHQSADRPGALRVFLDCAIDCDEDYFRSEISVISYVRERTDADLHVLIASQPTGGGGTEYTAEFIGVNRFAGKDQTLKYTAGPTATEDEQRGGLAEILKRGLVGYIAETPLADQLQITFAPDTLGTSADTNGDPWNFWVFRATLGGSLSGEESNDSRSLRGSVSANRTTEAWKLNFSTNVDYSRNTFALDETTTFDTVTKRLNSSIILVKSLTDRWSAGVVGHATSSTFLNVDLRARVAPGVEFNVFPYSQSTRKLLTVQYTIGENRLNYSEETIFGRTRERLFDHRLGTVFSMLQPWGSASAEVVVAQFLNRRRFYSISAFGETSVRLFKGFSFNTFATIGRTRDQIYLPKAGATVQEILVRQRQLATSYRYSVNFGISYSFGSIFNNVVNPRFGGDGADLFIF